MDQHVAEQIESQRQTNKMMVERLRVAVQEPYRDREPVTRVIDVVGRRSGMSRPFPVNVTLIDGRLYACSETHTRDWVRNLLAAQYCRVERDGPNGSDTERRPALVAGREAAKVAVIYLPQSGYQVQQLPYDPDSSLDEIALHLGDIAVVRLDPLDHIGPI